MSVKDYLVAVWNKAWPWVAANGLALAVGFTVGALVA